jgi:hypothetical protein
MLGSVFGGATLLALNHHRSGRSQHALYIFLLGAAVTAILIAIAMVLPDGIGRPIPIAAAGGVPGSVSMANPLCARGPLARAPARDPTWEEVDRHQKESHAAER